MIKTVHIPIQDTHGIPDEIVRVISVDDSAVIRSALTSILESDPAIKVVATSSNGELGIQAVKVHKPDIVLLDIEMPVMDGLTALPKILEAHSYVQVFLFSSLTEKGATATLKAFSLGAVECIAKPTSDSLKGQDDHFQKTLTSLVKTLARKNKKIVAVKGNQTSAPNDTPPKPSIQIIDDSASYKGKPAILSIGSSTGGPKALFQTLKECKGFDIPIIVTQHMPATFTRILAEHITQQTGLKAKEGEEGEILENGVVYVAPGGKHMLFTKTDNGKPQITLDDGPSVNFCKPAVDPMLDSICEIYGNRVLSVILTGMGHDGRDACKRLVESKGRVIAQDEETSVVWGMPGAVAEAGICSAILPLDEIGLWIKKAVGV
jgi:two-component system chemotaxis response regulator CheB